MRGTRKIGGAIPGFETSEVVGAGKVGVSYHPVTEFHGSDQQIRYIVGPGLVSVGSFPL